MPLRTGGALLPTSGPPVISQTSDASLSDVICTAPRAITSSRT